MNNQISIHKPNVVFYAELILVENRKTVTYQIHKSYKSYYPIDALRKKGNKQLTLFLGNAINDNPNAPALRLFKGSLNVTGLKFIQHYSGPSRFAYGYPPATERCGAKDPINNPFYQYRTDAFMFILDKNATPRKIEMIVLDSARALIPLFAKQLSIGGFDAELLFLRESAIIDPGYVE